MDTKRREGKDLDQNKVPFFFIYSFPVFLIVICMDPQNMMYYLLIMN